MYKNLTLALGLVVVSASAVNAQSYVDDRYSRQPEQSSYSSGAQQQSYISDEEVSYIDYDDDSYATRMRRFSSPMVGVGYFGSIYSPYYYDPFYMNPFVGWGSWYRPGFSISFGVGPYWSNCWGTSMWYGYPSFGWGPSFYSPWGYGMGYGGFGGYGMGFWDGYYAGYYNGYGNSYRNNRYHPRNTVNFGPRGARIGGINGRDLGARRTGPRPGLNTGRNARDINSSVRLNENPRINERNTNRSINNNNSRNTNRRINNNNSRNTRTVESAPSRNNRNMQPSSPNRGNNRSIDRNIQQSPSRNSTPSRNFNNSAPSRNFNSSPSPSRSSSPSRGSSPSRSGSPRR